MGSVVDAIFEDTAAEARFIWTAESDIYSGILEGAAYGTHEFRLLHGLQRLGNGIPDLYTLLAQLLSCSSQSRVLFDTRCKLRDTKEGEDEPIITGNNTMCNTP